MFSNAVICSGKDRKQWKKGENASHQHFLLFIKVFQEFFKSLQNYVYGKEISFTIQIFRHVQQERNYRHHVIKSWDCVVKN